MKLPVPKFLAVTNMTVELCELDENGAHKILSTFDVECRFEESHSVVYTKEGKKATLSGKAFIFEKLDKFPNDPETIIGHCKVNDVTHNISHAIRKLNPDGSINHIVLGLI
jgi:hypothetical protein